MIGIMSNTEQEQVKIYNAYYNKGYNKGRADAIDEFVELYDKFCNSDIVCGGDECIGKFCPRCFKDNFMEQLKEQK